MMEYKGFTAKVEVDEDAGLLHGEVVNIRDVITFEGRAVQGLKKAFHDSVDDYLEFCATRGEDPEKPFSGKFVVRIPPELHRRIYTQARLTDKSLNRWFTDVLEGATQGLS